jgi:hypothetical protein
MTLNPGILLLLFCTPVNVGRKLSGGRETEVAKYERVAQRTSVATPRRLALRARLVLQATPCQTVWLAELGSNGPNTRLQLLSLAGEMPQW